MPACAASTTGCASARDLLPGGYELKERIGLIGAGLMGHGIGSNVVGKGWPLVVHDPHKADSVADLAARGAIASPTVAGVAGAADVVILCVTGAPQVESIVRGDGGLLATMAPGGIIVDCSTSEPDVTRRLAAELAARGIDFADAPLSRTPPEAEAGRLNVLVGATQAVFDRIRPVLEAFSENLFHVGGVGEAHTLKLINNYLTMGMLSVMAEAWTACVKTGIDVHKWIELVTPGVMNSGLFQMVVAGAAEGEMDRMKFFVSNACKDMTYFRRLAAREGLSTPVAEAVLASLDDAVAQGFADRFMTGLIEARCRANGLPPPAA
jgi:3-hydroxyisobutyrate dehydrogenase-like beta-hydroxyacid dehydrogenase